MAHTDDGFGAIKVVAPRGLRARANSVQILAADAVGAKACQATVAARGVQGQDRVGAAGGAGVPSIHPLARHTVGAEAVFARCGQ